MSLAAVRTSAVAILTVAVALRVGLSQPPAGMLTTIASDPGGSLAASTSGWTTAGTLGSATAQGVRDIPVALFVWLGDALSLSTQTVQAFWYVLVTLLALLGALRLARTTARTTDPADAAEPTSTSWAPHVAAVVYACGPALLSTLSRSPSDGLVAATLPWIVAPLLNGPVGWRAAAASAAWLGLAGVGSPHWAMAAVITGVIAAAPMIRGRLLQLGRWLLLACLASAWWVAVLLWEAVHTIDVSAQLPEAGVLTLARDAFGGSTWDTGWFVMAVLASAAVAGAALLLRVGRRSEPLVAGLLLVSAGATAAHVIGVDVPVSAASAADGAPNVLAPVLSWVAVAGLASWAPLFEALRQRLLVRPLVPRNLGQAVTLGVAAVAVPASLLGFVLAAHERTEAPAATGLWGQVSQWSAQAPPGRVLVLPAVDGLLEPAVAKALGARPWVARDSVPLSGARATSALDDVVWRLSRGMGGPGTEAALERLGVAYVIVRNDLPVEADRTRPAALLRHALTVQGASRTAVFSSPAPVRSWLPVGTVTDFGVRSATQSLEVWSTGQGSPARLYDAEPLVVAGDAGTATDLVDAGLGGAPVSIAPPGTSEIDLVSDSPRRRDVDQFEAVEPYGPYLTASDDVDVDPPGAAPEPTATRRLVGVRSVDASSSAADIGARPPRPGSDPAAPLDGNPYTAWQAASTDRGEWWEVEFLEPTDLSAAELQLAQNPFAGAVVTRLRLEYDGGATEVDVPPNGVVGLTPATVTTRLRVVATEFAGDRPTAGFGIAELSVGRLSVRDELVVAGPPATRTWLFAARPGSRASCVPAAPGVSGGDPVQESSVACNAGMVVSGPDRGGIDRLIETEEPAEVRGRVWMRSTNSNEAGELADGSAEPSIVVTGSSVATPDLVGRPQAAADDDVTTSWRPAPDDLQPVMSLRWDGATRVTGLRLVTAPGDPASTPTRVRVQAAEGLIPEEGQDVDVRRDGTVRFDPVRTEQLVVTVLEDSGDVSLDTLTAGLRQLPIAIAETEVLGGPAVTYDGDRTESLPCGSGPSVAVGQRRFDTSVSFSADEIVRGTLVTAAVCGRPDVARGTTRVMVPASFRWAPLGLALSPADGPLGRIDEMSSSDRSQPLPLTMVGTTDSGILDLPEADEDGTLVVAVPAGEGWKARAGGELLPPVTVERWAQGWLVPAGTDQVRLDYSPAGSLRWAAGAGLAGWVVVLAVAALAARGWKRRRDQAMAGRSTQS